MWTSSHGRTSAEHDRYRPVVKIAAAGSDCMTSCILDSTSTLQAEQQHDPLLLVTLRATHQSSSLCHDGVKTDPDQRGSQGCRATTSGLNCGPHQNTLEGTMSVGTSSVSSPGSWQS
jgi:hypothetical protein